MKKLFLFLSIFIFSLTSFSQSYVGSTKKEMLKIFKSEKFSPSKIEKMKGEDGKYNGYYSMEFKFDNSTNWYYYTDEDYCYMYLIIQEYTPERLNAYVKDYDSKYLRAFDDPCSSDKKTEIWKEPKGDTFVYRWILCNLNTGYMFIIVLTKHNYDENKYGYIQDILGS